MDSHGFGSEIQESAAADLPAAEDLLGRSAGFGQVYTMPTGKQIHVYHEFPATRSKGRKRGASALQGFFRVVVLVILGAFVFLAGSTFATAQINGISIGEALDATLEALLP